MPDWIQAEQNSVEPVSFVLVFLRASVYPSFVLYRWPERLADPVARPGWLMA